MDQIEEFIEKRNKTSRIKFYGKVALISFFAGLPIRTITLKLFPETNYPFFTSNIVLLVFVITYIISISKYKKYTEKSFHMTIGITTLILIYHTFLNENHLLYSVESIMGIVVFSLFLKEKKELKSFFIPMYLIFVFIHFLQLKLRARTVIISPCINRSRFINFWESWLNKK